MSFIIIFYTCPSTYTWKIVITVIRIYWKYRDVSLPAHAVFQIASVISLLQSFHNTTDQNPFCFHPRNLYFTVGCYHNDLTPMLALILSFLGSTNRLLINDCISIMFQVFVQERISWLKQIQTDQQYFTCISKNAGYKKLKTWPWDLKANPVLHRSQVLQIWNKYVEDLKDSAFPFGLYS